MKWVFPKIGIPQNGWFIRENPIEMDDLGVPLLSETSKCLPGKIAIAENNCINLKPLYKNPANPVAFKNYYTIFVQVGKKWDATFGLDFLCSCFFPKVNSLCCSLMNREKVPSMLFLWCLGNKNPSRLFVNCWESTRWAPTWGIVSASKWFITTIYKPLMSIWKGTTPVRGRTNDAY